MKKIYLLSLIPSLFSFLPVNIYGLDVCGTIDSDADWGPETVNVTGDLSISATVTIAAGTNVIVSDQVMITVQPSGIIQAMGNEGDEIVFTAATPSVGWRGIYFDGETGDESFSSFQYCHFEYGKANGSASVVHESSGGVIYATYHSGLNFENCQFSNNEADKDGGATRFYESDVSFKNCVFENNTAKNFGVGGALEIYTNSDASFLIENCRFFNNSAYSGGAISVENIAELNIRGSLFANNEAYIAGVLNVSGTETVNLISNTMANNYTSNSSYSAISFSDAGSTQVKFINNIVHGNTSDGRLRNIEFSDVPSSADFENCLIEGGTSSISNLPTDYTWVEMIDDNPGFVAPSSDVGLNADGSTADWQLSESSCCINAGTADVSGLGLSTYDLADNLRIQQEQIDVGAMESAYVPTAFFSIPAGLDFKIWFSHQAEQIVITTDDGDRFSGALYDITGSLVKDKRNIFFRNRMTFPTSGLQDGIYVITILGRNGETLDLSKIVVN